MTPPNYLKPEIKVRHEYLAKWDGPFKVHCVLCGGLLLVHRDMPSMALRRRDCCTRCGQHYFYLDDTIDGEKLEPLPPEKSAVSLIRLTHERHTTSRAALVNVRVFAGADRDSLAIAGALTFLDQDWFAFRDALYNGAPQAGVVLECEGTA